MVAAAELANLDLDLIALQEVDRHWGSRSQHADVAAEMADALGYHVFFCASITDGDRQYGNAVLSRSPLLECGRVELSPHVAWDPANHETEPRTAAWARVEHPEPTMLINVHLANALGFVSTAITAAQTERLIQLVEELRTRFTDHLLVACGDFNLPPQAAEISLLHAALPRQSGDEPTWPVHPFQYRGWEEQPPPHFAVDHVFSTRPLRTWLGQSQVSDHLPVLAESQ